MQQLLLYPLRQLLLDHSRVQLQVLLLLLYALHRLLEQVLREMLMPHLLTVLLEQDLGDGVLVLGLEFVGVFEVVEVVFDDDGEEVYDFGVEDGLPGDVFEEDVGDGLCEVVVWAFEGATLAEDDDVCEEVGVALDIEEEFLDVEETVVEELVVFVAEEVEATVLDDVLEVDVALVALLVLVLESVHGLVSALLLVPDQPVLVLELVLQRAPVLDREHVLPARHPPVRQSLLETTPSPPKLLTSTEPTTPPSAPSPPPPAAPPDAAHSACSA